MRLELDITGDIVERQELLNGTTVLTLEGATADGVWAMTGLLSWNIGTQRDATDDGEGDLTLTRSDGAELFATLSRAIIAAADAEAGADHTMRLSYEIDGGVAEFESATGTATVTGALAADTFTGVWSVEISGHHI